MRKYYLRTERWKPINGYEGLYEISNKGRVKSLEHWSNGKHFKGKLIKPHQASSKTKKGEYYIGVILSKDGITKGYYIHRLVAMSFIPNPSNLSEINHKDENKQNNCVWNLEWITHFNNCNYGKRNIKISENQNKRYEKNNPFFGKKHSQKSINKMLHSKKCAVICVETNEIFNSTHDAAEHFNLCASTILRHIKNQTPLTARTNHSGLTFKYLTTN